MASRRMFSPDIVASDAFIEMPTSSQCLYFHLGMRADDDGFVNPQITMRMVGANADDLKMLLAKRFLLPFENGVVVVKHWRMNNFIRKDRYKATNYMEYKKLLYVKENGAYTLDYEQGEPIELVSWKSDESTRLTTGQPKVIPTVNAGKDRIGKDRIGKLESSTHTQKIASFFEKGDEYKEIFSMLCEKIPEHLVTRELDKFILYWTEPNKTGTKVKWQMQETFDVKRRIRTWFERIYEKNTITKKGKGLII